METTETTTTTLELTDNTFLRQYEARKGDAVAKVEYSQQERKIFLTKYIVPESLEYYRLEFKDMLPVGISI